MSDTGIAGVGLDSRARALLAESRRANHVTTDRLFAMLMIVQWAACIIAALVVSPRTWIGATSEVHVHVWAAILLGGTLAAGSVFLVVIRPGEAITRQVVGVSQVLFSALGIHLTGGRIETHFHVFGSLAFLAFYRDWRVLVTATVVVAADHFVRGVFFPASVFGVFVSSPWRWVEHAGWVLFEDVILLRSCSRGLQEMGEVARQRAATEAQKAYAETEVAARTRDLTSACGLLDAIAKTQSRFIADSEDAHLFEGMLGELVQLTGSEFGFVGEVLYGADGVPYLQTRDISDIAWDGPTRALDDANVTTGMVFHNLNTLFGAVITTGKAVLSNAPRQDARSGGVPSGPPPLRAFLGLPMYSGDTLVGVVGLANREGGYDDSMGAALDPLLATCAQLIVARRNVQTRRRVEAELKEAVAAAQAATSAKSEFLANMSHEIRTPMTAILGYADVLAESIEGSDALDALETVRRNGEHLLCIINDILDLSKIEAGKMEVERIGCSPMEIVSSVTSMMRARAENKGLSLQTHYAGLIPKMVLTDPTRLRQILLNLLGNAVKFTQVGGVRLVVRLVKQESPTMEFDVIDTGIGLTAEGAARLFRPFAQGDSSMARQFGGTGLGLTISRRFAELMGGDVWIVETKCGAGSHFRVRVPTGPLEGVEMLNPSEAAAATVVQPAVPTARGVTVALKCRVLLAEDDPDNQRLISHILRNAGAEVTVVGNGRGAVDAAMSARDAGQAFAVVLMDMQMPVMDGYEAVRELRKRGYVGAVIALTAHAMAGDRQKCLDVGCDDYASKPIDRQALIEVIRRRLSLDAEVSRARSSPLELSAERVGVG